MVTSKSVLKTGGWYGVMHIRTSIVGKLQSHVQSVEPSLLSVDPEWLAKREQIKEEH